MQAVRAASGDRTAVQWTTILRSAGQQRRIAENLGVGREYLIERALGHLDGA